MARKRRGKRGPSAGDLAEVRSGRGSARDRAEARGMRKLRKSPSRHRGKRAR